MALVFINNDEYVQLLAYHMRCVTFLRPIYHRLDGGNGDAQCQRTTRQGSAYAPPLNK
jgi:hypothetical protein